MKTISTDPRIDRLNQLLPAVHRMRDAGQKYVLQALLRVIAEQVNVVEDDIRQLYRNWFIETADGWVVPYIADLIGYRPVSDAGQTGDAATSEGRALNRVPIPRREVANTIAYRRRKGTLALLELLANDVAGWPAHAVEFFQRLGWSQNINHPHPDRARTVDVRHAGKLDLIDGAFDPHAHSVDVRRIDSQRTIGRYNLPSVGVFVWRLKTYSVTQTRAHCVDQLCPNGYTFSILGQDAPLFIHPVAESDETDISRELNVPAEIRREAFAKHPELYYGAGKSLAIWVEGWAGVDATQPVPVEKIISSNLTDWQYAPPAGHVAVDPVLGRFVFPVDFDQVPRKNVRVSYRYAFSADIGGGEYARPIFDPSPREIQMPDPNDPARTITQTVAPTVYRVGRNQPNVRIDEALNRWRKDKPLDAVIEIMDSGVYVEPISIRVNAGQTLQLRAANGTRPVIRLLDWQTDQSDALTVVLCRDSRFTLDGLLVTGRGVQVHGPQRDKPEDPRDPICGAHLIIRHCTLVPGWGVDCDCVPAYESQPSLELFHVRANVHIEHSILGPIQIHEDEVKLDPIPVSITDSIVDAISPEREALGAPGYDEAHAVLTIRRCTVFGIVDVHSVCLAENSIFTSCLNVARRQIGCMRFCHVPYGCRTPRRYHCQPDLAAQTIEEQLRADAIANGNPAPDDAVVEAAKEFERERVRPQFNATRYGLPAYCQLSDNCADEIKRGADDESEMGVFHDLFQPQRETNLAARLDEFTPAGMDVGIIHIT
jgi:hypothetical protein